MKKLMRKMVVLGSITVVMLTYQVANAVSASFSFESRKINANTSGLIGNGGNNTITFWQRGADNDTLNNYTTDKASNVDDFEKSLCRLGYVINDSSYSLSGKQLFYVNKATGCGYVTTTSGAVDDELANWLKTGLSNGAEKKPEGFTLDDLSTCTMAIDYYRSNGIPDEKRAMLYAEGKRVDVCQDYGLKLLGIKPGTKTSPNTISKIGGNAPTKTNAPIPDTIKKLISSTSQTQINPEATIAAASGSDTEKLACAASMKGGVGTVLKWFACPIVDGMVSLAAFTDNVINSLLTINTSTIFGYSDAAKSYHGIWANFRNLAAGLIVIAALVMVVSQVAGLEIMSAYTVRKVLPRLLFAVVFIASSWAVLGLLISLSNDLGTGIRSLFYGPFIQNGANSLSFGTALLLQFFGFTGLAAGAAYGIVAFGWIGLFLFAITAVLGALVAFAVIVFRELLVTVLVVMAPLAIAASILPNTQKFWTMWKSALLSVLIVFPIISAMIAGGHVLAFVAARDQGDLARQVVGFIAYFAPYFLLPLAFKMAGGLIGTVTGMVNDRSKGVFDRLSNARGNLAKKNMENFKYGQRYRNNTGFGKVANSVGRNYGAFSMSDDKASFLAPSFIPKLRERGRIARSQARVLHGDAAAMRYGDTIQAKMAKENDGINRALTYKSADLAQSNMARDWGMSEVEVKNAVAGARAAGGFGRPQQINALRTLADTGTGYSNLKQLHESVARVHGDDEAGASSTLGYINYVAGKNRIDLKTGYSKQMELYKATLKHNSGDITDQAYSDEIDSGYIAAVKGNDIVSLLRSKKAAVANTAPALRIALKDAVKNGKTEEAASLTGIINQIEQTAPMYAAPEIAEISANKVVVPSIKDREKSLDFITNENTPPSTYGVQTGNEAKVKRHEAAVAYSAVTPSYQSGAPISTPGDTAKNVATRKLQEEMRVNSNGQVYNPKNPNDLNNPDNPNSPLFRGNK